MYSSNCRRHLVRSGTRHLARPARQWLRSAFVGIMATLMPIAAVAADLMWGVNGHPFTAYPGVSYSQQLDLIQALGGKSYRVNVSAISQVGPLADLVALARNRGLQILPVLTPPVDFERETPQVLYATSFNFAATLAARFKNDIRVWELGNELENYAILKPCEVQDDGKTYPCTYGLAGGMTALEYLGARWQKVSAVLKGLSDGVVSIDPQLQKAMGTAGWGHLGAFDRMKQDGIAWDITVWHAYREEAEEVFVRLATFGKPIWITEFNHPKGSTDGEAIQANGLRKIMLGLRAHQARYRIEAAFVYELLDEPYWAGDFEAVMGLVMQEKSGTAWTPARRKQAFETVRQTISAGRGQRRANCDINRHLSAAATSATKVNYLYCLVLGRDADGHGLNDWSARLDKDLTVQSLAASLIGSDEFVNMYNPESLPDIEFVQLAQRLFGTAELDPAVLAADAERLQSGSLSRQQFLLNLLDQPGFRTRHPVLFSAARPAAAKAGALQ